MEERGKGPSKYSEHFTLTMLGAIAKLKIMKPQTQLKRIFMPHIIVAKRVRWCGRWMLANVVSLRSSSSRK